MSEWITGLRLAVRGLGRHPVSTAAALATLTLGIGGVTAVFCIVKTVLLTPLPHPDPDRLYFLRQVIPKAGTRIPLAPYVFEELRDSARDVAVVAAIDPIGLNLSGDGEPLRIPGARVSASFFGLLGVEPVLGRTFLAEEEEPGAEGVALISHGLWQSRFGGDAAVLGRELSVESTFSFGPTRPTPSRPKVVGVMPPDFRPPVGEADVWVPLSPTREEGASGFPFLSVVARLSAHLPLVQARAELDRRFRAIEFVDRLPREGRHLYLVSLPELMVGDVRPTLLLLWAASGLVLLIACANVANLLFWRVAGREHELAVREVLGSGRGPLIRLLLAEASLLALGGSVLGLGLSSALLRLLRSYGPPELARVREVQIDPLVLGFSALLCVVAGLGFGLAPALRASRPDLGRALRTQPHRSSAGPERQRLRSLLAAAEMALCLMLLIGASLVVKGLFRLEGVDPGYDPQNALVFRVELPPSRYSEPSQGTAVTRALLERYASVPGVKAVGAANTLPLSRLNTAILYRAEGEEEGFPHRANYRHVSPGYLGAMSIPLLEGRPLHEQDLTDPPRVALVNHKLAREIWPGRDPLGQRLRLRGPDWPPIEVVGVTGDVRQRGAAYDTQHVLYLPRLPWRSVSLVVRTDSDPERIAARLRRETTAVDPRLAAFGMATLGERLALSVTRERFQSGLMATFALVALVLAMVGVYGVTSCAVASRGREIGVRMALGASRARVLGMVLRQGSRMALWGTLVGCVAALLLTRLLTSMLPGVAPNDPLVFGLATLGLNLAALVSTWIPARRAASLDPVAVLRAE